MNEACLNFFDNSVLNSAYEVTMCHWELVNNVPTNKIVEERSRFAYAPSIVRADIQTGVGTTQDLFDFRKNVLLCEVGNGR